MGQTSEPNTKTVLQIMERVPGDQDDKISHEIDVTGKSKKSQERVESGVNINLNHDLFYTQIKEIADRELVKSY